LENGKKVIVAGWGEEILDDRHGFCPCPTRLVAWLFELQAIRRRLENPSLPQGKREKLAYRVKVLKSKINSLSI